MKRTLEGQALTEIILIIFKLNGLLILEGDHITKSLGLSSARWKVLGALAATEKPMTVPDIARTMGLTRQAVQRLANEMQGDGLLCFQLNPKHRRAKLLSLSKKGMAAFKSLEQKQIPWANSIADGTNTEDLQTVSSILQKVITRLESN